MAWQVGMSTLGAIILIFVGFRQGGHPNAAWPVIWPILVSATVGILIYKYVSNILEEQRVMSKQEFNDSIVNNGLINTGRILLYECEQDEYYSAGRGAAAYSNTIIILGMIVCGYYAH